MSLTTVLSYEEVGADGNTQTKLFKYDDPSLLSPKCNQGSDGTIC